MFAADVIVIIMVAIAGGGLWLRVRGRPRGKLADGILLQSIPQLIVWAIGTGVASLAILALGIEQLTHPASIEQSPRFGSIHAWTYAILGLAVGGVLSILPASLIAKIIELRRSRARGQF